MKRILNATVWARNGVPADSWRFRGIFRWVLPLTDLLFLYFGLVGWANGIHTVSRATGHEYATWWSATIAVCAFAAFIGVSFPRLWALELVAKIGLVGLVFLFVVLSAARVLTDFHASATAGLVVILVLLPAWRAGDLGYVAWTRGHRLRGTR